MTDDLLMTLQAGAGRWCRTLDDPSFAHAFSPTRYATFRLQILQAPACHPIALAIQILTGEGTSVVNAAEILTARIWREHLPDEPSPPLWVWWIHVGEDHDPGHRGWVSFGHAESYQVQDPTFHMLDHRHHTLLSATGASPDRGQPATTKHSVPPRATD